MPRAPRIEFAGAIYHVMNRGNQLAAIARDDMDRQRWVETLGEACRGAGWRMHSFVLMGNHYHLLIETPRPTLVKGMQWLNATYTKRYNVRHKTYGHLFQGRYKALLVDGEEAGYFLTVSDYIHLNPVRARLIEERREFFRSPWSSAGWLAGVRKGMPLWMVRERVDGELGLRGSPMKRCRGFREHLQRRMDEVLARKGDMGTDGYAKIRRGWCLGGEGFVGRMKERLEELMQEGVPAERWNSEAVEEAEEVRAERLLAQGLKAFKVKDVRQLAAMERSLLARWVRQHSRVTVGWLAQVMGLKTRGGMASSIHLAGRRLQTDRFLASRWRRLEQYDID